MAGQVYFGTKQYQTWIKAPASPLQASSEGYVSEQGLLNGRAYIKRSMASHRKFEMSWFGELNNSDLAVNLQTVKDYADGFYGTAPYYWLDPFAMTQNLMPPHWASPMLVENDWPNLVPTITPTFAAVTYANNFPYKTASYAMTASQVSTNKLVIIIPTGYTLSFGWHTSAAGVSAATAAGIRITPYLRATGLATTVQNPASLLAGSTNRVSTVTTAGAMSQFSGATYSYVEIYFANGSASPSTASVVSMMAEIFINGTTPPTGTFIPGKGTTSLEFASSPQIEYYSSAIANGQVGMSATLVEI